VDYMQKHPDYNPEGRSIVISDSVWKIRFLNGEEQIIQKSITDRDQRKIFRSFKRGSWGGCRDFNNRRDLSYRFFS